jgi:hypothetical protein
MRRYIWLLMVLVVCSCSKSGEKTKESPPHLKAESSYRSWIEDSKDDYEYASAHIVNKRFSFVPDSPVAKDTAKHLALLETFDLEESMSHEQGNGTITVEAFPTGVKTEQKPIWSFKTIGRTGEVFRDLYKVHQIGCCEATDRDLYFSLKNGLELFTTTEPALLLQHVDLRQMRYIGYDGGSSEQHPPEMMTDKNIIGIVMYGDNQQPAKRLAITGKSGGGYICKSFKLKSDNKSIKAKRDETIIYSDSKQKDIGGFSIVIELEPKQDGPAEHIEIPIESDKIAVDKVKSKSGLKVKLLN